MYEHWNESTSDYDVVQNGSFHFHICAVGFEDAGRYRCSKRCNSVEQSPYCYFAVNGNEHCILLYCIYIAINVK